VIGGPIPALRALPARVLSDLAFGLRSGRLAGGTSRFMIRYAFPDIGEPGAAELAALLENSLGLEHAALLLEAVAAERTPELKASKIELVTSGPDAAGSTRDTGVVLRELFGSAKRRVLIVGFAVHQGREIFAVLGERMRQVPDLAVRICLDIRRNPGDTTRTDALLRRFAERFLRHEWPGPRPPEVFYDPRSLIEGDALRASLHAKCVVADGERIYIGSANFTEAAQLRNIEIGVAVRAAGTALAIEGHFAALIERGHLRRLPLLC
jgi:phosphatidylserine/phosphatidylglycerophosphate/cardiolipin synthase-like enzyme